MSVPGPDTGQRDIEEEQQHHTSKGNKQVPDSEEGTNRRKEETWIPENHSNSILTHTSSILPGL